MFGMLRVLRDLATVRRLHRRLGGAAKQLVLHGPLIITRLDRFSVGDHTVLNEDSYFVSDGGLSIGRYCHIARRCTIFTVDHTHRSTRSIPYDEEIVDRPVTIGDFVWIGANVSIAPGVTIGEGAVIGMGALVARDIPPGAIVGGSPAKVLASRDMELFAKLKSQGKFH